MLLVTISNIDRTFHGVFDTDDKKKAADAALIKLVADHGFFDDTRVHVTESPDQYGVLVDEDQLDDVKTNSGLLYHMQDENSYLILIRPYVPGTMFVGQDLLGRYDRWRSST